MAVLSFPGTEPAVGLPTSIAVIGCGPSGMFFCHAMEKLRREAEANPPKDGTQTEFEITVFERSSVPGGVWRSADAKSGETVDMYEELWTNGPSPLVEMYDYTFDDHFGKPVPVYLKRQDMFEYITSRVTKHCPDFFDRYAQFNSEVENVEYDEGKRKFIVTTRDLTNDITSVKHFDKCIWACGDNGKQKIPQGLLSMFQEGGFKGDIIHSANVANLEQYVKEKRILLIGGSHSGEDVAFQSIKLGAEKIYIATRDSEAVVCQVKRWPGRKVKVLSEQTPVGVTEDGSCIQFAEVEWRPPSVYRRYEGDDEISDEIRDIDTIIFCTGYSRNFEMLSNELRELVDVPNYQLVTFPDGWKPEPHAMDVLVGGDVKPEKVWLPTNQLHPNLYNGVLIPNPNFVLLTSPDAECVLYSLDIYAYATAQYITGMTKLPDKSEMRRLVQETISNFFANLPMARLCYDENYYEKATHIEGYLDGDMDDKTSAVVNGLFREESEYSLRMLCGTMRDVNYPDDIGTREALNDRGKTRVDFDYMSGYHRSKITFKNKEEKKWKTFRDCDDSEEFYSLFTGTKAVGLERPWMEL